MKTKQLLPIFVASLFLLGAGCTASRQTVTPQPIKTPASVPPASNYPTENSLGSTIPADFPTDLARYPNGRVVIATKFGTTATLAQFTNSSPSDAIAWIKQRFQTDGATLESESLGSGSESSTLLYKKGNVTYNVRLDVTSDGKAYLTTVRDEK